MRITVCDILSYLASGMSTEEILQDFPYLESADIQHGHLGMLPSPLLPAASMERSRFDWRAPSRLSAPSSWHLPLVEVFWPPRRRLCNPIICGILMG
jgi:hypothetical protein